MVLVTTDCVILRDNDYNDDLVEVLLIKRGYEPYDGFWALPGGKVDDTDKNLHEAALRELKEETNISDIELTENIIIGNNTRDPRGFVVTVVYYGHYNGRDDVCAGDDAVDYGWFDIDNLPQMAFDHAEIIEKIKQYLGM